MSTSGANLTSEGEGLSREATAVPARSDVLPGRSIAEVLKSYFYWTYPRGSFHYDVMVTLILLFIFVTPLLWDYGDKPRSTGAPTENVIVRGDGRHGLMVTLHASDVNVAPDSPDAVIKKALKEAMQPVLGDSVFVERWQLTRDGSGNPQSWTVWAHR